MEIVGLNVIFKKIAKVAVLSRSVTLGQVMYRGRQNTMVSSLLSFSVVSMQ